MAKSNRSPDPRSKTVRALLTRSGNVCAFDGCDEHIVTDDEMFLGEIAHICAAAPLGPRYDPTMTEEQRRNFDNLLVLCPRHHKVTDDEALYPPEALRAMKARHLERVRRLPPLRPSNALVTWVAIGWALTVTALLFASHAVRVGRVLLALVSNRRQTGTGTSGLRVLVASVVVVLITYFLSREARRDLRASPVGLGPQGASGAGLTSPGPASRNGDSGIQPAKGLGVGEGVAEYALSHTLSELSGGPAPVHLYLGGVTGDVGGGTGSRASFMCNDRFRSSATDVSCYPVPGVRRANSRTWLVEGDEHPTGIPVTDTWGDASLGSASIGPGAKISFECADDIPWCATDCRGYSWPLTLSNSGAGVIAACFDAMYDGKTKGRPKFSTIRSVLSATSPRTGDQRFPNCDINRDWVLIPGGSQVTVNVLAWYCDVNAAVEEAGVRGFFSSDPQRGMRGSGPVATPWESEITTIVWDGNK